MRSFAFSFDVRHKIIQSKIALPDKTLNDAQSNLILQIIHIQQNQFCIYILTFEILTSNFTIICIMI